MRITGNCEAGVEIERASPAQASLLVYPNPGRHGATVSFGLPVGGRVRVAVYDVMGRCVTEAVEGDYDAGWHSVVWQGRNTMGDHVCPGVYFVRLSVGGRETTRKVLLVP